MNSRSLTPSGPAARNSSNPVAAGYHAAGSGYWPIRHSNCAVRVRSCGADFLTPERSSRVGRSKANQVQVRNQLRQIDCQPAATRTNVGEPGIRSLRLETDMNAFAFPPAFTINDSLIAISGGKAGRAGESRLRKSGRDETNQDLPRRRLWHTSKLASCDEL